MMKHLRKLILFVTAICLCCTLAPTVFSEEVDSGSCGDNLTWVLDDEGVLMISGTGDMYDYEDGVMWSSSAPWSGSSDIVEVVIGAGVTSIGDRAFSGCHGLETFTVSSESEAFVVRDGVLFTKDMTKLVCYPRGKTGEAYTVPDGVSVIQSFAFVRCSLTKIILPNSLTTLEDYALDDCELSGITIPSGVTSIGTGALWGVEGWVIFAGDAPRIDTQAFSGVNHQYGVCALYPINNVTWESTVQEEFSNLREWISYSDETTLPDDDIIGFGRCGENLLWEVTTDMALHIIGSGVMYNYDFFYGCNLAPWGDYITSITIDEDVSHIGIGAFANCTLLTEIEIPYGIGVVGQYAFYGLNISEITIPDSVVQICSYAFAACRDLTRVIFIGDAPELGIAKDTFSDTGIGNSLMVYYQKICEDTWAVYTYMDLGCDITWISYAYPSDIPGNGHATGPCGENLTWTLSVENVLTISGSGEMYNYEKAYDSLYGDGAASPWMAWIEYNIESGSPDAVEIIIEPGVTGIGDYAFTHCSFLQEIRIPDSVTSIGQAAFADCSNLTKVNIPDNVTSIGRAAFARCSNLTKVSIPDGVMELKAELFSGCYRLTEISIPYGITKIEAWVFESTKIQEIIIPDTVVELGSGVFFRCDELRSITLPDGITQLPEELFFQCHKLEAVNLPDTLLTIDNEVFAGCSSLKNIVIPKSVTYISDTAFYNLSWPGDGCESLETITVSDDNEYYTSIDGMLFDKNVTRLIVYPLARSNPECIIPESVQSFNKYAFSYSLTLRSVVLPAGITEVSESLFRCCKNLTEVIIPDSVTKIGKSAFNSCENLIEITLPDGVEEIGDEAFMWCISLEQIDLPDGLREIGGGAFEVCNKLTCVVIPDGITELDYTFKNCDSLVDVTLPDSIQSLNKTFSGCSSLTTVNVPDGVKELQGTFFDCSSLTNIVLPESLEELSDGVFECSGLESITLPSNVWNIYYRAFANCLSLTSITFTGDAPIMEEDTLFWGVNANAYYPEDNETWTEDVRWGHGGIITWIPYDSEQHEHSYESSTKNPTCKKCGYMIHTCTVCGTSYVTDEVPALNHDMGDWVVSDVTCTANGSMTRACNRDGCDYSETEWLTTTFGHSYIPEITAPDCINGGYTTYTCSRCGDSYVANEVPALDHDLAVETHDPTCIIDGSKVTTCTRCDFNETEVLPATGHSHEAVVTAPTCTDGGYTAYTCHCGDSYVADETAALGHSITYAVETNPTLEAEGVLIGTCTRCGTTSKIVLPKLSKTAYTLEVITEPTKEAEGFGKYTWTVTDYGIFTFEAAIPNTLLGDVNDDGTVGIADLMRLANHFAKGVAINEANADVNDDGKVTIADLMRLANFFAGKAQLG